MENSIYALILAAGKGTRMPSKKPKVLQTILGDSMLACVYNTLSKIVDDRIFTLVGYEKEQVQKELTYISPKAAKNSIVQEKLLGTGQAFKEALPHFKEVCAKYIFVINGDVPLIKEETLLEMIKLAKENQYDCIFASIEVEDIASYGRVVRKENKAYKIVEAKDYNTEMFGKASNEINAGLYLFSIEFAEEFLPKLKNDNANNEYYITDLVNLGIEENKNVYAYNLGYDFSLLGANNPYELHEAEEFLRKERNNFFMKKGVILHNPTTITIGYEVEIEAGAEIFPHVELYGKSKIAKNVVIDSHCLIKNSIIGEGSHIRNFSHIEEAECQNNCVLGPYARLRPKAKLKDNVKIGNFVEVKKSLLENNVKVNHLSYIGDANIGESTNIGAGTITCNYDGINKFTTEIGANCFIGSNTALVAPVTLEDHVLVGAGSVVTKNAKKDELVIARSKQVNLQKRK